MRSCATDTCAGIVASLSTGSAMPPADLISAASVRVKSALLATSATRYPCANKRSTSGASARPILELLLERPHVELVAPGTRVLMGQEPEGVRDGRGLQEILVLGLRQELSDQGHVDGAVHVDVCDVDTLGMKVPRHDLRQPAHGELGGPERRRVRPRLDTGGRPGDEDRSLVARQHRRHDLARPKERAERMHAPGLLEDLGRGLHEHAEGAPAAVVDQHLRGAQLASDAFIRRRHLCGDRRVALDRKRDAARGSDLGGEGAGDVTAPRHQRHAVPLRESAGEGGAQPGADADHYCDRRPVRYVHRSRPYQGALVHTTGCPLLRDELAPCNARAWVPSSAGRSSTRSTTAATATRTPPGRGSGAMRPSPGSSPRGCCPSGRSPATRTAARSCATTGGSSSRRGSQSSPRSRRPPTPRRSATCSTWTRPSTAGTAIS